MPVGLTNGPARYTRLMNLALNQVTWTHCLVYLDDIIIWASSFEEHLRRLRLVSDRIQTAGLKLKPTKCQFLKREVSFLWHVISSEGIKTDPGKVETVRTWPTPVDIKELQASLVLQVTIGGLFLDSQSSQNHSIICLGRVLLSIGRWNKKVPSMN